MSGFRPAAVLAMMLILPLSAKAQDVMAGAELARSHCSECHQTGAQPAPSFGFAPAFAKIAATQGVTETSIIVFLSTPHEPMPNYVLSQREIHDVAAYIIGLKPR